MKTSSSIVIKERVIEGWTHSSIVENEERNGKEDDERKGEEKKIQWKGKDSNFLVDFHYMFFCSYVNLEPKKSKPYIAHSKYYSFFFEKKEQLIPGIEKTLYCS